jgi:hypothetical protein
MTDLSNELGIVSYFHCGKCLNEKPDEMSPRDFQKIQAGFTKEGIQIWCLRHECNILHVDFEGITHPANTTAKADRRKDNE